MLHQLISHSEDLAKLRNEGYDIEIVSNFLIVKNIPYVSSIREIKFGTLVSELTVAGHTTTTPNTHVAYFEGDYPCHKDGTEISQMKHTSKNTTHCDGVLSNHSFSSKPSNGYKDFYEKMTTYANIISGPAQAINPDVTPKTFPVIEPSEEESVFNYLDTASSRAGISEVTQKLELEKIAIVGLGGTGSYVLDLIAKTPVKEIHLFDGDVFLNHNAFRAPGAPAVGTLQKKPKKVDYFKEQYSKMHRHIISHSCYIDSSTIHLLQDMKFVFLCLDGSSEKRLIVDELIKWNTPFVDVGMGIIDDDGPLTGLLRVTACTATYHKHIHEKNRIPFSSDDGNNDYSKNIQIADLNALNAAMAVVKWKKISGFYIDFKKEHFSVYAIGDNIIINEDNA